MTRLGFALRCFFKIIFNGKFADKVKSVDTNSSNTQVRREAAQVLALLQEEGRLVDFLQEEIDDYEDEQIGAAVRDIHKGCRKVLRENFSLIPVMEQKEGEKTIVAEGFDPNAIKLFGKVAGNPPFHGTIRHHGWKLKQVKLPANKTAPEILAQAEIELD